LAAEVTDQAASAVGITVRFFAAARAAAGSNSESSAPFVPEKALRAGLGVSAIVAAVRYAIQALS
jgi:hypothetical protein